MQRLTYNNSCCRKLERLLFPLKDRLLFYVRTQFHLNYIFPLLSHLNRSVILICHFNFDKNSIVFPENVHCLNFNLLGKDIFQENVQLYLQIIVPEGIIVINRQHEYEQIWWTLAKSYGINTLCINDIYIDKENKNMEECNYSDIMKVFGEREFFVHPIITYINKEFPYYLLRNKKKEKLYIGCDKYLIEGWLNTDTREGGDIKYLEPSKKYPFQKGSFRYIFVEDTFERLDMQEITTMLSECYRILDHGGHLRISLLNYNFFVDLYLHPEKELNQKYINWSINNRYTDSDIFIDMDNYPLFIINTFMHEAGIKMIHDQNSVKTLLKRNGFHNIEFFRIGESNDPNFKNIEQLRSNYPVWINQLEMMAIEAVKL